MLLLIDSSKGYEEYLSGLPNKSAELKNLENEQDFTPYERSGEYVHLPSPSAAKHSLLRPKRYSSVRFSQQKLPLDIMKKALFAKNAIYTK